jgi:hypothetical protein
MKSKQLLSALFTVSFMLFSACKKEVVSNKTIVTGKITNTKNNGFLVGGLTLYGYKTTEGLTNGRFGFDFNYQKYVETGSTGNYRLEFDAQKDTTYLLIPNQINGLFNGLIVNGLYTFPESIYEQKIKSNESQVIDFQACPSASFQIKYIDNEKLTFDSLGVDFTLTKPCENIVSKVSLSERVSYFFLNSTGGPIISIFYTESGTDVTLKLTRFQKSVPVAVIEKKFKTVIGINSPITDFEF